MNKKKITSGKVVYTILKYAVVLLLTISMLVPFIWMVSASFKTNLEIFTFPIKWIPEVFHFENYTNVWERSNYPVLFFNTVKLTVIITVLQLVTSTMAAYAFSKIKFPERDKLFLLYLATLMVPYQVVMIPQFSIIREMGLVNSHWSLILIQAFSPMGVFLIKQFFDGIPDELIEAARIDGLGDWGIYSKIMLPLSKSAMITSAILTITSTWNDFLAPLIYLSDPDLYTIQLGLRNLTSQYTTEYGQIMAASVISVIPILVIYCIFQNFFQEGLVSGAVKG
ncbi:carbohydrate ABC transporter permease [Lachnoclostridium sp. An169]|uniref:carbohydrate ABC transporter permease n=1 Tax=Lachnoclostridium sp. An169 TaxID=1965569 RepID=UPI000B36B478|nr:carbohydrate ABC transporter permease [Lachnoclostridium sp. An169]